MTFTSNRSPITSLICTLALIAMVSLATSTNASAQCCRTYAVTVAPSVPACAFPLTVATTWSNGIGGSSTFFGPGNATVTAPIPPGCWLAPLTSLTLNGVAVPPAGGGPIDLGGGCFVNVALVVSASNPCITIVIF